MLQQTNQAVRDDLIFLRVTPFLYYDELQSEQTI
jgi:hypothetical protein